LLGQLRVSALGRSEHGVSYLRAPEQVHRAITIRKRGQGYDIFALIYNTAQLLPNGKLLGLRKTEYSWLRKRNKEAKRKSKNDNATTMNRSEVYLTTGTLR
jgi:hypothetical protein